jgi:hypothetical protein
MGANTIKIPQQQREERRNIFKLVEGRLRFYKIFDEGLPVQYLPKVLFVAALLLFYIGNAHYAERTTRQTDKLKTEVDDLRADYTTLKADLMFASKQSEVARKVLPLGLEESSIPPYKIIIKEE